MPQSPYESAIALLACREYSSQELFQKLIKKFTGQDEEINKILQKLIEQGYQSDERFTEAYVNMRTKKGFGPERIALELHYKGITRELVEHVLAEQNANLEIESSPLFLTWLKKFKNPPKDFPEKQKQIRFLRYRGYSAESVNELFHVLEDLNDG